MLCAAYLTERSDRHVAGLKSPEEVHRNHVGQQDAQNGGEDGNKAERLSLLASEIKTAEGDEGGLHREKQTLAVRTET